MRILEIVNGAWALFGLLVTAIFGRYILVKIMADVKVIREHSGRMGLGTLVRIFVEERINSNLSAACAIFTYFLGETIARFWMWAWRYSINNGISTEWMVNYHVPIIGGILCLAGASCMVRIFTPSNWGVAVCAIGTAVALAIPVVVTLL